MNELEIRAEPASALAEYATVPIAFEVRRTLDVETPEGGLGGIVLVEKECAAYTKDYDAEEGPRSWAATFDLARWGFFAARLAGRLVGCAAVAFDTPGIAMLEGRSDLAVLWDIRVAPEARRRGVGAELLRSAQAWARARGCRTMKVETQNVNVPACRFYARHGFVLGAIHRFAYPTHPDEVQLLWYADLG
jgi:GNAT superfamily N-acetyltransferase